MEIDRYIERQGGNEKRVVLTEEEYWTRSRHSYLQGCHVTLTTWSTPNPRLVSGSAGPGVSESAYTNQCRGETQWGLGREAWSSSGSQCLVLLRHQYTVRDFRQGRGACFAISGKSFYGKLLHWQKVYCNVKHNVWDLGWGGWFFVGKKFLSRGAGQGTLLGKWVKVTCLNRLYKDRQNQTNIWSGFIWDLIEIKCESDIDIPLNMQNKLKGNKDRG